MWAEVILNVPIAQSFTYSIPEKLVEKNPAVCAGLRAAVMFGRRKMTAFIIKVMDTLPDGFSFPIDKIQPLLRIIDSEIIFTEEQIQLAQWTAKYYICSPGEALAAMLPSGRRETDTAGFSFEEDAVEFMPRVLSDEQEKAVEGILKSCTNSPPQTSIDNFHYLYGSTGSGKTEVFLRAAEYMLEKGLGVIYLVPEIGLTHQVIEAAVRRFGQTTAVIHSGLTGSQKLAEWRRIMSKEARIVIGARSAVFAPVPDLGLIIIDEEHDASYKSGTTPRYHARQAAMMRCRRLKIPLVMGSATPSLEAYYFMQQGLIQRHTLTCRLCGGKEPEIEIVNLAEQQTDGSISKKLEAEMRVVLAEKRQTILFLNRRGFTHFFRCSTCGFEMKCKNCSVAMTYHKSEQRLRCHYCGWTVTPPAECPECHSLDIGYSGFGTEFIESEVRAKFPNARIERIDTDSLTEKDTLRSRLDEFRKGNIDILLGTQMVAKGLNFPGLKLVGVVMADTGLHMPDFRAAERTFSLLVQVAGRAGRFFPDGKVIVQTYNPQRPAVSFACRNDIDGFYAYELEQRKMLEFPPFSRMIRLVFRSPRREFAEQAAEDAASLFESMMESLGDSASFSVLGPAECPLAKIAANYRFHILLRAQQMSPMQKAVTQLIYRYKQPSGVYIEVDADPVSLL